MYIGRGNLDPNISALCQCLMYNAVALVTNSKSKVARERAEFLVKVLDDVLLLGSIK